MNQHRIIKFKLLLSSFVTLFGLIVLVIFNNLPSKTIDDVKQAQINMEKVYVNMLLLRKHEKDFLARKDLKYYNEFNRDKKVLFYHLSLLKGDLNRNNINSLSNLKTIHKHIENYAKLYNQIVERMKKIGLDETQGLHRKYRDSIHTVQNIAIESRDSELLTKIYELRKEEKDFLLRKDLKYVEKYESKYNDLMASNHLTKKILDSLANYEISFFELVQLMNEIGLNQKVGLKGKMRAEVHLAENLLDTFIEDLDKITKDRIDELHFQSYMIVLCILLLIVISTFVILNSIKKPLNELNDLKQNLEDKVLVQTNELQKLNKNLKDKLYFDDLTDLWSRHSFFEDIQTKDTPIVFLIDINNFKIINQVYTSEIGSKVLIEFAKRLKNIVNDDETYRVYRISADEFAIVDISEYIDVNKYELLIEVILDVLNNTSFKINDNSIDIDITVGISTINKEGYLSAKTALDYAKEHKKSFMMYSLGISQKEASASILKIKNDISLAIDEKRVKPVYQPIVDENSKIIKYETLMRLQKRDSNELISPLHFLDVAIKTRLYKTLSSTIIFTALELLSESEYTLSVNFTYSDIENKELVYKIEEFLKQNDVGKRAVFEITESENIESYDKVKKFIERFRKYGVKIAIDDFGSGFSNFEYILEIEPDYLKIDGSLIKNMDNDTKSYTLVKAITKFSQELGILVIAEYVHSKVVFDMLKEIGVDEYQGFYFSEPLVEI